MQYLKEAGVVWLLKSGRSSSTASEGISLRVETTLSLVYFWHLIKLLPTENR